nr:hypothetical protein KitaXyl93_72500 [Kitasatospora sp. Xyl93]
MVLGRGARPGPGERRVRGREQPGGQGGAVGGRPHRAVDEHGVQGAGPGVARGAPPDGERERRGAGRGLGHPRPGRPVLAAGRPGPVRGGREAAGRFGDEQGQQAVGFGPDGGTEEHGASPTSCAVRERRETARATRAGRSLLFGRAHAPTRPAADVPELLE